MNSIHMRPLVLLLALLCSGLAGCTGEGQKEDIQNNLGADPPITTVETPPKVLLVDYYYDALLSTDLVARDSLGLCGPPLPLVGNITEEYEIKRLPGHKIFSNHTYLNITINIDESFSKVGVTGHRFGIYYGSDLVYWSDSIKESTSFNFPLDAIERPIDDSMVRFFRKLTDPTTEDDESACTSGIQSGSIAVDIYAA